MTPTPRGLRRTAQLRGRPPTAAWRRRRAKASSKAMRPAKGNRCCGSGEGTRRPGGRGCARGREARAKQADPFRSRAHRVRSPGDEESLHRGVAPGARGRPDAPWPRRATRALPAAEQGPSGAASKRACSDDRRTPTARASAEACAWVEAGNTATPAASHHLDRARRRDPRAEEFSPAGRPTVASGSTRSCPATSAAPRPGAVAAA